jgi:hypothetical protein
LDTGNRKFRTEEARQMGEREMDVEVGDGVAGGSFSPLEL